MVVATYFYYEKVHRTLRTAILSNLLKVWFLIASEKHCAQIHTPKETNDVKYKEILKNHVLFKAKLKMSY